MRRLQVRRIVHRVRVQMIHAALRLGYDPDNALVKQVGGWSCACAPHVAALGQLRAVAARGPPVVVAARKCCAASGCWTYLPNDVARCDLCVPMRLLCALHWHVALRGALHHWPGAWAGMASRRRGALYLPSALLLLPHMRSSVDSALAQEHLAGTELLRGYDDSKPNILKIKYKPRL